MRCCHRANASLKCRSEICDRSGPLPGMGDDGSDGCERIFDAVVEFGIQDFAGLLGSPALGDVDVHADYSLGAPLAIVQGEAARLDPSHLAVGKNNAILQTILALSVGEGLAAKAFQPLKVVGKHQIAPLVARNLGGAFGEAI